MTVIDLLYCDHCGRKTTYVIDVTKTHVIFKCSVCLAEFPAERVDEIEDVHGLVQAARDVDKAMQHIRTPGFVVEHCFRCGWECDLDGYCMNPDCSESPLFGLPEVAS